LPLLPASGATANKAASTTIFTTPISTDVDATPYS